MSCRIRFLISQHSHLITLTSTSTKLFCRWAFCRRSPPDIEVTFRRPPADDDLRVEVGNLDLGSSYPVQMEVAIIVIVVFVLLLLAIIAIVRFCNKFECCGCCDSTDDSIDDGTEGRDSDDLDPDEGHRDPDLDEELEPADDDEDEEEEDEEGGEQRETYSSERHVTVDIEGEEYIVNKMEESLL